MNTSKATGSRGSQTQTDSPATRRNTNTPGPASQPGFTPFSGTGHRLGGTLSLAEARQSIPPAPAPPQPATVTRAQSASQTGITPESLTSARRQLRGDPSINQGQNLLQNVPRDVRRHIIGFLPQAARTNFAVASSQQRQDVHDQGMIELFRGSDNTPRPSVAMEIFHEDREGVDWPLARDADFLRDYKKSGE